MGSSEAELPGDVIHRIITKHILCDPTITNKTAVQLSLVSKEFSRAVQRRPVLIYEWENDLMSKTRCLQELKYIVSTLNQESHIHHLQTFTIKPSPSSPSYIRNSIYNGDHSSFDRCIELAAAAKSLINLNLKFWNSYSYVLPQPVLNIESLVQLDLETCRFPEANSFRKITWSNLKKLRLFIVYMGEGVFENIIRGCPAIKFLELIFCDFHESTFHIRVSHLRHLQKLRIGLCDRQTFEVDDAPNLECLEHYHSTGSYPLPVNFGKHDYRMLRRLTLNDSASFDHDFLTDMDHQFPRLEELCISAPNPSIKRICLSSSSLKKIKLNYIQKLEEATFNVPDLVHFELSSDVDDIPKLSFAGNSGRWISHITYTINNANINSSSFLKLKEFLAANATNTTLISVDFMDGITRFRIMNRHPQISTDTVYYPGSIQAVNINRWSSLRTFCVSFASKILDGILLICRPRRITIWDWPDCRFIELLYDSLMGTKGFNDHQLLWNIALVYVTRHKAKLESVFLEPPHTLDKDKFMELFKIDDDDWKPMFDVNFKLEY